MLRPPGTLQGGRRSGEGTFEHPPRLQLLVEGFQFPAFRGLPKRLGGEVEGCHRRFTDAHAPNLATVQCHVVASRGARPPHWNPVHPEKKRDVRERFYGRSEQFACPELFLGGAPFRAFEIISNFGKTNRTHGSVDAQRNAARGKRGPNMRDGTISNTVRKRGQSSVALGTTDAGAAGTMSSPRPPRPLFTGVRVDEPVEARNSAR